MRIMPIVIFSSSDREHDMRSCYELGATAYVMKPVDTATFRQTVARIHAFWIGCNRLTGSMPPTLPPASPGRAGLHPGRPSPPSRPSGRHKTATP
jgi:DNA-binding NarL/FixJ family response regulator